MSRFIDADKFVDNFNDEIEMGCSDCTESVHNALNSTPTADVAPVIHGHWIEDGDDDCDIPVCFYTCSKCGAFADRKYPYCHCGARMDEEENNG